MLPKIKNTASKLIKTEHFHGMSKYSDGPSYFTNLKNACPCKGYSIETVDNNSHSPLTGTVTGYLASSDKEVYTTPDGVYIDNELIPIELSSGQKKLIRMGANLIILPDFVSVALDGEHEVTMPPKGHITGQLHEVNIIKNYPLVYKNKKLFLYADEESVMENGFKEGSKGNLYFMHKALEMILPVTVSYVDKTDNTPEGKVRVGFETEYLYSDVNYFYIQNGETEGTCECIVFAAALYHSPMPKLDFVVEHRNRLWGCSSKNHEIYCSKLGDPYNWGEFNGISTDPWTATVGSEGDFTAAAVYGDSVVFFKEKCLHMVRGTRPENYNITQYQLDGVKNGCDNSVVNLSGLLYYRGNSGVYAFNGVSALRLDEGLPSPIGTVSAAAGAGNTLLMASGKTLYLFDVEKGDWHIETVVNSVLFITAFYDGESFCLVQKAANGKYHRVTLHDGCTAPYTESRAFMIRTAPFGSGNGLYRYFNAVRLYLFADVPDDSSLNYSVYTVYGEGNSKKSYTYSGRAGLTELVLHPMRCERISILISGSVSGDAKLTLKGIYAEYEEGSGYVY